MWIIHKLLYPLVISHGKTQFIIGKTTNQMAIFHSYVANYQRVHQELWWRTNILHLIRWGFILKMDERDHNPFVERVRNQIFNENHLEQHLVSGVLGRKLIKGGRKPSCYWVYRLPGTIWNDRSRQVSLKMSKHVRWVNYNECLWRGSPFVWVVHE